MANVQLLLGSSWLQLEKFRNQPLPVSAPWDATTPIFSPILSQSSFRDFQTHSSWFRAPAAHRPSDPSQSCLQGAPHFWVCADTSGGMLGWAASAPARAQPPNRNDTSLRHWRRKEVVAWTTTNTCTLASHLRSCDSGCPHKARTLFLHASAPHCSRGLVQRLDISDTSAKSKPELAALQGFILLMSQLGQLELVTKEELQKLYHKCWRDWERHGWRKQELQSCGRTSLTFAVREETWCALLQHSLTLPLPRRQSSGTANADSPRIKTEAFPKYQMEFLSSGKWTGFFPSIFSLT